MTEAQIKTRIIHQKQKNGDIYVIERQTRYDPEKKYNTVLSSKLIGKIPAGGTDVVPTREKAKQPKPENPSALSPESISSGELIAYDTDACANLHANSDIPTPGYRVLQLRDSGRGIVLFRDGSGDKPVFLRRSPNLPDAASIADALNRADIPEGSTPLVITDCAFESEKALAGLLNEGFRFISSVSTDIRWVSELLKDKADSFMRASQICPFNSDIHGQTCSIVRTFTKPGTTHGRYTAGAISPDDSFTANIYLHLFYSAALHAALDEDFDRNLDEIRRLLEEGTDRDQLTDRASDISIKYLYVRHFGSKLSVKLNDDAIALRKKYHGFFALVSGSEADAFRALAAFSSAHALSSAHASNSAHALSSAHASNSAHASSSSNASIK